MKTLRYLLTIGLPFAIFIFIMIMVLTQNTDKFDSYVYDEISKIISPELTEIVKLITFFGSSKLLKYLSGILLISILINKKYSFNISMIIINIMLSAMLNEGIKNIIQRSRPDILRLIEIKGYSFPSGHSMISMSFYGLLIFLCLRNCKSKWKYIIISLFLLLILLIGFSRIYLGVHYASDVLGGYSLGIAWIGAFSIVIDLKYKKYKCQNKA
ncbi:phosphatase PAP2 family protein [Ruminiclostridium herbifermentans]|uniref:Phosphatase PAP2 family protein n=1 Tax=Ruminiclostridium herbifermentans TaxID=2488810 RepID=A0A4U7JN51_9FIRM|nr:phosphatase PAP2 family protein [Ruminiclostridium herbifermentans]QNU68506.1 phosphatase PAP2 family protein [Ruminiclostridium herbifermentans]